MQAYRERTNSKWNIIAASKVKLAAWPMSRRPLSAGIHSFKWPAWILAMVLPEMLAPLTPSWLLLLLLVVVVIVVVLQGSPCAAPRYMGHSLVLPISHVDAHSGQPLPLIRHPRLWYMKFSSFRPKIWNALPDNVVSEPFVNSFRHQLKTFLFQQSFCC